MAKNTLLITREDYLNKLTEISDSGLPEARIKEERLTTYREYFLQFVGSIETSLVNEFFTSEQLKKAYKKDPFFNTIPHHDWLRAVDNYYPLEESIRKAGENLSVSTKVSILKTAAWKIISTPSYY